MEWHFPPRTTPLELELLWRHLRRSVLPQGVFFGPLTMHEDPTTFICELTGTGAALHAWELSTNMVALTAEKVLLHTEAALETWQARLTSLMQQDPEAAIIRLKWRPSRHGGRPWAVPAATQVQLAAARRTSGGRKCQAAPLRNIAEIHVRGSTGYDAQGVYRQLMSHLSQTIGITLAESTTDMPAGPGHWRWLGADEPVTSPGRVRLYLGSDAEVQSVRLALHGRSIQVGMDRIAVQVTHDLSDMPGNLSRGRGHQSSAPAV